MKKTFLAFALFIAVMATQTQAFAQKFSTREGHISFFSKSSMEDIEANNHKVSSVIDAATGKMEFAVLMKSFVFEKALMQEHFNENYVHSDKFPKSTFKGEIENLSSVNLSKNGTYDTEVKGNLTMHGVTKPVSAKGTVTVKDGNIIAKSKFKVKLADYDIVIPAVVKDNISETVEITVNNKYTPLAK